jgi:hypothetical protein
MFASNNWHPKKMKTLWHNCHNYHNIYYILCHTAVWSFHFFPPWKRDGDPQWAFWRQIDQELDFIIWANNDHVATEAWNHGVDLGELSQESPRYNHWLVVWNSFLFFLILGMSWSQLTSCHIFQRGWAQPPTSHIGEWGINPYGFLYWCLDSHWWMVLMPISSWWYISYRIPISTSHCGWFFLKKMPWICLRYIDTFGNPACHFWLLEGIYSIFFYIFYIFHIYILLVTPLTPCNFDHDGTMF